MSSKKEAAKIGKMLKEEKLVIGTGGNISVRDRGFLVIKKKDADMSRGQEKDYIRISLCKAEKDAGCSSSEAPFHLACYNARDDVGAVIHVHSPYMVAAAAKTARLMDISYEFNYALLSPVPVIKYIQPGSCELAETIGKRIKKGANAVLLKKHGAVIVGKDAKEAFTRTLALERACITFLLSRGRG